jgi:hypothetical protein
MKKKEMETAKREDHEEEEKEEWAMTDFLEEKAAGFIFFLLYFLKFSILADYFFRPK